MTMVGLHFSRWRKARGLFAAAAVAWSLTTLVDIGFPSLAAWFASAVLHDGAEIPSWQQIFGLVALDAVFGIPLALLVCFAAGFPAWALAERRGLRTRAAAFKVGAGVGLLVGTAGILLGVLAALPIALDDNMSSDAWSWGGQIIHDGLPTLLGWAYKAISLIVTMGIGCLAGLAAWAAAGRRVAPV